MRNMERFLKDIEKRAFRMAQLATRSEADALDIVQEAMLKLVMKYSDRDANEWQPLFLKILENRILDWHRKEKLKSRLFFWRKPENDMGEVAPERVEAEDHQNDPVGQLLSEQMGRRFLDCVEALPIKQQQCFLLRCWEGLTVSETAEVMGINDNSVKSHYFRANEKLKQLKQTLESEQ